MSIQPINTNKFAPLDYNVEHVMTDEVNELFQKITAPEQSYLPKFPEFKKRKLDSQTNSNYYMFQLLISKHISNGKKYEIVLELFKKLYENFEKAVDSNAALDQHYISLTSMENVEIQIIDGKYTFSPNVYLWSREFTLPRGYSFQSIQGSEYLLGKWIVQMLQLPIFSQVLEIHSKMDLDLVGFAGLLCPEEISQQIHSIEALKLFKLIIDTLTNCKKPEPMISTHPSAIITDAQTSEPIDVNLLDFLKDETKAKNLKYKATILLLNSIFNKFSENSTSNKFNPNSFHRQCTTFSLPQLSRFATAETAAIGILNEKLYIHFDEKKNLKEMYNISPYNVKNLTTNLKIIRNSLDKVISLPYLSSFWKNHKSLSEQYQNFCDSIGTQKNIALTFLEFLDNFRNRLEEVIPLS